MDSLLLFLLVHFSFEGVELMSLGRSMEGTYALLCLVVHSVTVVPPSLWISLVPGRAVRISLALCCWFADGRLLLGYGEGVCV